MARRQKNGRDGTHGRSVREKPHQRNAANARERTRMRILSRAFSRLKTTLPWVPADTKLSKLDTLRLATSYIAHLRTLLCQDQPTKTSQPLALTWPFTFTKSPPAAMNRPPEKAVNYCRENFTQYNSLSNSNQNQVIERNYAKDYQDYEMYSTDIFQLVRQ